MEHLFLQYQVLNDELIQDEIVSLSQGTITEYSIISSIETKNGYNVTTKSTVSLGKLTSFVQSKENGAGWSLICTKY